MMAFLIFDLMVRLHLVMWFLLLLSVFLALDSWMCGVWSTCLRRRLVDWYRLGCIALEFGAGVVIQCMMTSKHE